VIFLSFSLFYTHESFIEEKFQNVRLQLRILILEHDGRRAGGRGPEFRVKLVKIVRILN
jgi:hypothetical protein